MTHKITTKERLDEDNPIEVWESADGAWRWEVYKDYQKDRTKPYARAMCRVFSPITREQCSSGCEVGDVYWADIKSNAHKVAK